MPMTWISMASRYNLNWPGTNPATDAKFHPAPISFSSPLLNPATPGPLANYDMTVIRSRHAGHSNPQCDTTTGVGCTNPPAGAAFYPFYSIGHRKERRV